MRLFQQTGCKTWRVRFSIEGRAYDKPLKTHNKEVAETKARELIRETEMEMAGLLNPKVERETAHTPLLELLNTWVDDGLPPDVTAAHRTNSLNRPSKVIAECGWRYVRDISAQGFEGWRNKYHREGWSAKTLNDYLSHFRTFLGWMNERGMIGLNPLKPVKLIKNHKGDSLRAFSVNELTKLIEAVPEYRSCLYRIAAFTGLRRSELKTLEWCRVNLSGDCPSIELAPEKTKNRKGGTLPLLPDAREAMNILRALAPADSKLVFFKGVTQMLRFRKDIDLAGIDKIDSRGRGLEFHTFRRSLATILSNANVAPRIAMQLMRHGSMQQTYEVYTDSNLLETEKELQKVPTLKSSLISSLKAGKRRPNLSTVGKESVAKKNPESFINKTFGVSLSTSDHDSQNVKMADPEGFEPSIPSLVYSLSRGALSTTQPQVLNHVLLVDGRS